MRSACAYVCALGNSAPLSGCESCGAEARCGHPQCFRWHLEQLGLESSALYLCPSCLRALAQASATEPCDEPDPDVLEAIEELIGGLSLSQQLRCAHARGGLGDADERQQQREEPIARVAAKGRRQR